MDLKKQVSLRPFNTFGFDAHHYGLITIRCETDIIECLENQLAPLKILGGGSNILITQDIGSYILHNAIKGIHIMKEDERNVWVRAGGGELWHDLVHWSLENNLGGLENLSWIPGSVGAAPMQNIGAYGVEQDMYFDHLEAINMDSGEKKIYGKESCAFGYRESIFKSDLKNKCFITHVTYRLDKPPHTLHLSYGAILEVLAHQNINQPTIQDVSSAVISIRQSKLPDPKETGNAGSFFKNPVISKNHYSLLLADYPHLPHYPVSDTHVKVPAGWLIEFCGFKGMSYKHVGVHTQQELVLVHYGEGAGQ
jgi:UDP-N-acetylmuramate dehydrogenase